MKYKKDIHLKSLASPVFQGRFDPHFPSMNYQFSRMELDSTDWFSLVHMRNIRRPMQQKNYSRDFNNPLSPLSVGTNSSVFKSRISKLNNAITKLGNRDE